MGKLWKLFVWSLDFRGRSNRAAYWKVVGAWYGLLFGWAILTAAIFSGKSQTDQISSWIVGLMAFAGFLCLIWMISANVIRRLHDRDKRGWWALLFYVVPLTLNVVVKMEAGDSGPMDAAQALLALLASGLGIWGFVEMGCLEGTIGDNRFGPDPLTEWRAKQAHRVGAFVSPSRNDASADRG